MLSRHVPGFPTSRSGRAGCPQDGLGGVRVADLAFRPAVAPAQAQRGGVLRLVGPVVQGGAMGWGGGHRGPWRQGDGGGGVKFASRPNVTSPFQNPDPISGPFSCY